MVKRILHIFLVRESYLLIGASMFFGLFVSLSLRLLFTNFQDNHVLINLIVLTGELAMLVPPLFILRQREVSAWNVLPLQPVALSTVLMAVVLVIGVIGLVSVFEVLVLPYFPLPDSLRQLDESLYDGGLVANAILVVAAVIVAPLVEELLFRGLLQQSLFYHFGSLLPTLLVPALIFGLFHISYLVYWPAMAELLGLALLLGWLMLKTGNIWIPILVHALFNLSAFTALVINGFEETSTLADLGLLWILGSVILTSVGLLYFKFMKMHVYDEVYQVPLAHEVEI